MPSEIVPMILNAWMPRIVRRWIPNCRSMTMLGAVENNAANKSKIPVLYF